MTDDEAGKKPEAPPFATSRLLLRCSHCAFLVSARSPEAMYAMLRDHVLAVHPHGGTQ